MIRTSKKIALFALGVGVMFVVSHLQRSEVTQMVNSEVSPSGEFRRDARGMLRGGVVSGNPQRNDIPVKLVDIEAGSNESNRSLSESSDVVSKNLEGLSSAEREAVAIAYRAAREASQNRVAKQASAMRDSDADSLLGGLAQIVGADVTALSASSRQGLITALQNRNLTEIQSISGVNLSNLTPDQMARASQLLSQYSSDPTGVNDNVVDTDSSAENVTNPYDAESLERQAEAIGIVDEQSADAVRAEGARSYFEAVGRANNSPNRPKL